MPKPVVSDDEVHRAVAEMADSIEENNRRRFGIDHVTGSY
jgi:hypothetical protein